MKKKILLCITTAFILSSLAACGSKSSDPADNSSQFTVGSPDVYQLMIPNDYHQAIDQDKIKSFIRGKNTIIVNTDFTTLDASLQDDDALDDILESFGTDYDLKAGGSATTSQGIEGVVASGSWSTENRDPSDTHAYILQNTETGAVSTIIFVYEKEPDSAMEEFVVESFHP